MKHDEVIPGCRFSVIAYLNGLEKRLVKGTQTWRGDNTVSVSYLEQNWKKSDAQQLRQARKPVGRDPRRAPLYLYRFRHLLDAARGVDVIITRVGQMHGQHLTGDDGRNRGQPLRHADGDGQGDASQLQ